MTMFFFKFLLVIGSFFWCGVIADSFFHLEENGDNFNSSLPLVECSYTSDAQFGVSIQNGKYGGIYFTSDFGGKWEKSETQDLNIWNAAIAMAKSGGKAVAATTTNDCLNESDTEISLCMSAFYASVDFGQSWRPLKFGTFVENRIYEIVLTDSGKFIYALGSHAIHISDDFGATWSLAPIKMRQPNFYQYKTIQTSSDGQFVFVLATADSTQSIFDDGLKQSLLIYSADFGITWKKTLQFDKIYCLWKSLFVSSNGEIVTISATDDNDYLLRSTNYGASFDRVTVPFNGQVSVSSNGQFLAVQSASSDVSGTAPNSVVSLNGGETWEPQTLPAISLDAQLRVLDSGRVVVVHTRE